MQTTEIEMKITTENQEEEDFVNKAVKNHDYFMYSGEITHYMDEYLEAFVSKHKKCDNVCLILSTPGGDADGAYKAARRLNRIYKKFTVLVNGYCKSAGTLFAIGSNELIVTPNCEFGPLDVQLFAPDEFMKRSSGMAITQAMEWIDERSLASFEKIFLNIRGRSNGVITTKTAGDIASEITKGLYSAITEKIDPNVIGEIKRSTDIAYHYGQRLGASDDLLHRLIEGYPSHGFVIDVQEALDLFKNARLCTSHEYNLISKLSYILVKEYKYDYTNIPSNDTMIGVVKATVEAKAKVKPSGKDKEKTS